MTDTLAEEPTGLDDETAAVLADGFDLTEHDLDSAAPVPALRTGYVGSTDVRVIPGDQEWSQLCQVAVTFAGSQLVPKALQGQPANVLLVLMTARELGLSVSTALREAHPIDGRVTLSPKLRLALVRERGLGRLWKDPASNDKTATWYAVRHDEPEMQHSSTFTWPDAERAKLTGKDNWQKYPARMLSWRALGYLLDEVFGEVGSGLYQPDELGAVTDEEGNPIDVDSAEAPAGFRQSSNRRGGKPSGPTPADPAAIVELRQQVEQIRPVPAAVADLVARWSERELPPLRRDPEPTALVDRHVPVAKALVADVLKRLAAGDYAPPVEPKSADPAAAGDATGDSPVGDGSAESEPEPTGLAETDDTSPSAESAAGDTSEPAATPETAVETAIVEDSRPSDPMIEAEMQVAKLKSPEVVAELKARSLPTSGNEAAKRLRLATALYQAAAAPALLDES